MYSGTVISLKTVSIFNNSDANIICTMHWTLTTVYMHLYDLHKTLQDRCYFIPYFVEEMVARKGKVLLPKFTLLVGVRGKI
jgi:hypothetical protein